MRFRAVTLDAAGTLLALAEPVGVTYARLAARHGIPAEPTAVEARFRRAFATAPPLAFPGAPPAQLEAHERAWWFALVREALGPAAHGERLEATFAACWTHYAHGSAWRLHPEVPGVLRALRADGLRTAVVSNSDARLLGVLADLGLDGAVDAVVCSARAGAAKPDPAIFHTALQALGSEPAMTLHAGDSPVDDVEGARAAGLAVVLIARDAPARAAPAGIPCLRSLRGLPALAVDGGGPIGTQQ